MAKNMYQKREERKSKKMNDDGKSFSNVSINWYPGHMAKTKRLVSEQLNLIDLVYEVIDARMPYSSKIKDIENTIKNKPRILIMTKMDLCDKKETDKWIKYYENKGYKVIGFNLETNPNLNPLIKLTDEVMQEYNLKRESKGMIKRKTRVLVIGIPNVGKSTLINRLAGKKVNDSIELLDTPGILWPKLDCEKVAFNLASLTAIKEEILPIYDVIDYILNTLYKYYPDKLLDRYGVNEINEDIVLTYEEIGKRRGCLVKGGEIDYDKVVNVIMNDIKNGNIKNITFDRYEEMTSENK